MKNYFEKISPEELCEVFGNNGYIITNLEQIYSEEREQDEEPRDSLFVLCEDTKPDPVMDGVKKLFGPWSFLMGTYGSDYTHKIFTVGDFFIDEICPLQPHEVTEERLHALNETYRFKMCCKFPTYESDFKAYCEQLASNSNNEEMIME